MKIINKTKNTVLAEDAVVAGTVFRRLKGILGRKAFIKGEALIITPCNSIHTFFMRFPIDVLFVDKHNRVIKVVSSLAPGRLTPLYFMSAFVIELPAGTAQASFTSEGDTISIE
jgi:uncharacterized membrane protein (UPF0127 family)